ncbi:hypothetical protein LEN26_012952 [Aphanomyces euteiches]|nr:hypothetical protein LEN26_012952 [Aphanomyces euteiches]
MSFDLGQLNFAMATHEGPNHKIIVDSGASSHITGEGDCLQELKECNRRVIVADGKSVVAKTSGTLKIKSAMGTNITLTDVLLVEGMPTTLLSIPALMRSSLNATVKFSKQYCMIYDGNRQVAKATLTSDRRLYALEGTISEEHANVTLDDTTRLWHNRIGHLPLPALQLCANFGLGVPKSLGNKMESCLDCPRAKMHKVSAVKTHTRTFKAGECWHSDTKGPLPTMSNGGSRYYTVYVDDATGYKIVRIVKSTDSETQSKNFAEISAFSERQTGRKVKVFRSDDGPEYKSGEFEGWLKAHGIKHERSAADNQSQNGVAERAHRTLMEMALATLIHARLHKQWWAEAINTAAFILNRVLHTNKSVKTPFELFSGHVPTLKNMRVFGCECFNMVRNPEKRNKLDPKATLCIMMGYSEDMKAYKLYDVENKKMTHGVHVKFLEDDFFGAATLPQSVVDDDDDDTGSNTVAPPKFPDNPMNPRTISNVLRTATSAARGVATSASNALWRSMTSNADEPYDPRYDAQSQAFDPFHDMPKRQPTLAAINEEGSATPNSWPQAAPSVAQAAPQPRYPSRLRQPTPRHSDSAALIAPLDANSERYHIDKFMQEHEITHRCDGIDYACNAAVTLNPVPQSHKEAMATPDWRHWKAAEEAEVAQLLALKTWVVAKPPDDRKVIRGRWTYARKTDAIGNIIRWKARWVLKGFIQVEGVDYDKTSSNVIKMTSMRAILAVATARNLVIEQADAINAYIQAKLERPIWAVEPEGFETQTGMAAHVHKALYGLNQSGREWELHCKQKIAELGWHQSAHDPCVFTRGKGHDLEYLGTYVDDFIAATKNQTRMDKIMEELASKMNLKRMGPITYILGIKITRNMHSKTLMMTQDAYANKVLSRFIWENAIQSQRRKCQTKKTYGTTTNNRAVTKKSIEQ